MSDSKTLAARVGSSWAPTGAHPPLIFTHGKRVCRVDRCCGAITLLRNPQKMFAYLLPGMDFNPVLSRVRILRIVHKANTHASSPRNEAYAQGRILRHWYFPRAQPHAHIRPIAPIRKAMGRFVIYARVFGAIADLRCFRVVPTPVHLPRSC